MLASCRRSTRSRREDYVLVDIPEYETYSLLSLYQVLNSIRAERYPEVYAALQKEIGRRVPESVTELEDCYFALDKDKHPEYEASLRRQIERLGGFQRTRIEPITEQNKYLTFWRRFWAYVFDTLIIGAPLAVVAVVALVTGNKDLIESATSPQVLVLLQLAAIAYYVILHGSRGQTVGKMITGVKVLDVSESRAVGWRQAIVRDVVPLLAAATATIYVFTFGAIPEGAEATDRALVVRIVIGLIVPIWALVEIVTQPFNRKRRALQDFISRTVVVRIAN